MKDLQFLLLPALNADGGSHSWSQCLAWILSETQQELKSLQISLNLWDFSLWFCLRAFNSHSESNLHLCLSLCRCSFNCGWLWTRGAHTGFDDNWKTITIWGLTLCFRGDMSRTWSFNYKHISCLPPFFLQKRWDHPFCPCRQTTTSFSSRRAQRLEHPSAECTGAQRDSFWQGFTFH